MEQMAFIHPQLQFVMESPEHAFMTGSISLMHNIYDITIEEIILNLNLNEDVANALLHRKGHYGCLLQIVEHDKNSGYKRHIYLPIGRNP
jgi:c-di-GMP-related signal transduction protein